jgi:hypothetical protein
MLFEEAATARILLKNKVKGSTLAEMPIRPLLFSEAVALAIQPSQPLHRDDVPSRRAGHDRVAGSGVDREVKGS